jgi:hypothetical protein
MRDESLGDAFVSFASFSFSLLPPYSPSGSTACARSIAGRALPLQLENTTKETVRVGMQRVMQVAVDHRPKLMLCAIELLPVDQEQAEVVVRAGTLRAAQLQ